MAEFPARFESEVIAELRGVVNGDGESPLWSALGSHFFQMEFPKAETLTSKSKKFIADLMPRHPVYIPLLPISAQEVIGQVHSRTRPARAMLTSEGFRYRGYVDIFDGGPTLHSTVNNIRVIRENVLGRVHDITPEIADENPVIISNCQSQFRACTTVGVVDGNKITIDEETAAGLQLKIGDSARVVNLKPNNSK